MGKQASLAAGGLVGAVSGLAAALAALWFAQTVVPKVLEETEGTGGRHVHKGAVTAQGLTLHSSFGLLAGAAYGAAAEYLPQVAIGFGSVAGLALWAATEPFEAEKVGLAKWPTDGTPTAFLSQAATYAVFGVVMEGMRQVARLEFN